MPIACSANCAQFVEWGADAWMKGKFYGWNEQKYNLGDTYDQYIGTVKRETEKQRK
jgi:hypothetical protein